MASSLTDKLRAFAHRKLEGAQSAPPVLRQALHLAGVVNELLGQPIRGASGAATTPGPGSAGAAAPAKPAARFQAPVRIYFDGKDHRTKAKVEELLRSREIVFQVLDVGDDEAEKSWVTTAARTTEFPIVVIAGAPVGGFGEVTQLDLQGELTRRVFGPF